ncbi:MAG: hypothetical protein MI919_31025, partial [Holophagales bacterium]|nr:hypothetical protein [Holophagales bacterium]
MGVALQLRRPRTGPFFAIRNRLSHESSVCFSEALPAVPASAFRAFGYRDTEDRAGIGPKPDSVSLSSPPILGAGTRQRLDREPRPSIGGGHGLPPPGFQAPGDPATVQSMNGDPSSTGGPGTPISAGLTTEPVS